MGPAVGMRGDDFSLNPKVVRPSRKCVDVEFGRDDYWMKFGEFFHDKFFNSQGRVVISSLFCFLCRAGIIEQT